MVKKTSRKTSCPPGTIERKSFTRKSRSGSKKTSVSKSCVPAKGKAIKRGSKTPEKEKVLPEPSKELKLRKYGYSTSKSESVRHSALRKAIKENGEKPVMRHLNLIRNYQADIKSKNIMNEDVKYLKSIGSKK